jgi:hypothetical protein
VGRVGRVVAGGRVEVDMVGGVLSVPMM